MMSARIQDRISSAVKPTTLPITTPITPSMTSCTIATEITKPCVAPRLFINATVSMRRCAKRRADIATATALSNRLITAVKDRNRLARSAAAYARSPLSSALRSRSESGNRSCIASSNCLTASSLPAINSAYRTRLPSPMSPLAGISATFKTSVGASDAKPIDWSGRYVSTAPMRSSSSPTASESPTSAPTRASNALSAQTSPGAGMPLATRCSLNRASEIRTLPRNG